jgi:PBP1b-binding outer membrane lipoprotein LpoB
MKRFFLLMITILFFSGCATWSGIKEDSKDAAHWTKQKLNQSAEYVKEKTE